jgi:hypothetical protein
VGELEIFQELAIGGSLLERTKILPLNVLYQSLGQRSLLIRASHNGRHLIEAGALGGSPAALTGDEFVAILIYRAYDDWLEHPYFHYRSG